jgi:hypothetical protein
MSIIPIYSKVYIYIFLISVTSLKYFVKSLTLDIKIASSKRTPKANFSSEKSPSYRVNLDNFNTVEISTQKIPLIMVQGWIQELCRGVGSK